MAARTGLALLFLAAALVALLAAPTALRQALDKYTSTKGTGHEEPAHQPDIATRFLEARSLVDEDLCTADGCKAKADKLGLPFSTQRKSNGAPAGCIRYKDGRVIFVETCSGGNICGTTNCNGCSVLKLCGQDPCADAVCPEDACPDGKGRRRIGDDCCACPDPCAEAVCPEDTCPDGSGRRRIGDDCCACPVDQVGCCVTTGTYPNAKSTYEEQKKASECQVPVQWVGERKQHYPGKTCQQVPCLHVDCLDGWTKVGADDRGCGGTCQKAADPCAEAVCTADVCPDGGGRRRIGNNCCACPDCHDAVMGEGCHHAVTWAMNEGIISHPEWYPGLTQSSSFNEFQMVLHRGGHGGCPVPCSSRVRLVWADEFDVPGALDSSRWSYEKYANEANKEEQCYTDSKKNAWVSEGKLKIAALREESDACGVTKNFTSARLRTAGKGDWRYGRVEVRARLPLGRGSWPAIWMLPTEWKYGRWPSSGEIDIMEHVGHNLNQVHGTVHTHDQNHLKGTQVGGTKRVEVSEWHTYSILWSSSAIVFLLDEQEYFRFKNDGKGRSETWPFNQGFHLLLNVAVGGSWGGERGVDNGAFDPPGQVMEIEYVRVYQ